MRTIKFRAWDRYMKCMVDVKTLDFGPKGAECAVDDSDINGDIDGEWDLMQYTGIKDSNGIEIYEGDILEFQDFVFGGKPRSKRTIVEWSEGDAAFITGFRNLWKLVELGAVVVGNIYDNPELLGELTNEKPN